MSFLSVQGTLALASRLKVLSERSYDLVDQVYREHGIGLQARWFPVDRNQARVFDIHKRV